jgi:thioredoxin-like negative regulator of GroEL
VHRENVLLVLLSAIAVAGFLLTRTAAAHTRGMRLRDAAAWFETGQRRMVAGNPDAATEALRHAAAIDRDNTRYLLALANALSAAHHVDETRQVLLRLREREPEDPEINIHLARLEAGEQRVPDAVRYYQSALYGRWNPDAFEARRKLRLEMIHFLLAHGDQRRALSELLILSGNLPDDTDWHLRTAALFAQAGDARRALSQFVRVLVTDAKNPEALAGAGRAALSLGDYWHAQRYLRAAPPNLDGVASALRTADLVLANDPLAPRLPLTQRRARMTAGLSHAIARLDTCLAAHTGDSRARAGLTALRGEASDLQPSFELTRLRESPESIDIGVSLVSRIEQATASGCGQPDELDRAWLRIGQQHNTEQP